jgi:uncharacterized protein YkwD
MVRPRGAARTRARELARARVSTLGGIATVLALLGGCARPSPERPRIEGDLDLDAARQYVLERVNADRRAEGLEPVARDPVAERAAQEHAEDMAKLGFTAHWGSDGSVPEQRYTRSGGRHFVQENAACFFDGTSRALDPHPRFRVALLDQIESAFLAERPPHDGHRRNILKTTHTALGIGLAQPTALGQPCMAQEFVDAHGAYSALPQRAKVGQVIRVEGELSKPVEFGGVGLSRIDTARRLDVKQLNATSSYPIPAPYQSYFAAGFQGPKAVQVVGRHFSIDLPLSDRKRPGRYGVSIWGIYPDHREELVMVSLRTIDVR